MQEKCHSLYLFIIFYILFKFENLFKEFKYFKEDTAGKIRSVLLFSILLKFPPNFFYNFLFIAICF